ncbi:MliC family protein [Paracoccus aerodenitrificans]|uniref:MliC family protein n=1 Tax=Paracoccus aerodenitrificans TaxID=3017781 RepID=UPI0022F04CD5|nr:MliC family protein [Paracoccus aerodenitrificans]WBU63439.1 MliC family protein [Paracoccus aerodenitrificans]
MFRAALISAFSLAVAGSGMAETLAVTYDCADDRELQTVFVNSEEESHAVIYDAGRLVPLSIAVSGSGARYLSEDGRLEFWTKGPEAMLTLLGDENIPLYRDCRDAAQAR